MVNAYAGGGLLRIRLNCDATTVWQVPPALASRRVGGACRAAC